MEIKIVTFALGRRIKKRCPSHVTSIGGERKELTTRISTSVTSLRKFEYIYLEHS